MGWLKAITVEFCIVSSVSGPRMGCRTIFWGGRTPIFFPHYQPLTAGVENGDCKRATRS